MDVWNRQIQAARIFTFAALVDLDFKCQVRTAGLVKSKEVVIQVTESKDPRASATFARNLLISDVNSLPSESLLESLPLTSPTSQASTSHASTLHFVPTATTPRPTVDYASDSEEEEDFVETLEEANQKSDEKQESSRKASVVSRHRRVGILNFNNPDVQSPGGANQDTSRKVAEVLLSLGGASSPLDRLTSSRVSIEFNAAQDAAKTPTVVNLGLDEAEYLFQARQDRGGGRVQWQEFKESEGCIFKLLGCHKLQRTSFAQP
ncbi:hypothetical protein EDD21DRAFT_350251 [Dissophora ornata]|nr:hypothetical protein EDD21DRAFT_350251 [Dissophora ornata]